jgi:orotate phosphoribosyltransferase
MGRVIYPEKVSSFVAMQIIPSKKIAKSLLEIGAFKINLKELYTWTSGIKSPIYCDNRIINSKVGVRNEVINEFSDTVASNFLANTDSIAGVATGGMTYGVLIANRLSLPFVYVRAERKEHGLKKVVEGYFNRGDRVVVIEDHISTGKSSIQAVDHLREEGLEVVCLLSIMTYGFKSAEQAFKDKNIPFGSICNLDTVLDVAREEGSISKEDVDTILAFRDSPKTWGPNKSVR